MADRWLTMKEAAERFGGSRMRVYRRIWAGHLEASNEALEGAKPRYRIRESAIERYFEERTIAIPTRKLGTVAR